MVTHSSISQLDCSRSKNSGPEPVLFEIRTDNSVIEEEEKVLMKLGDERLPPGIASKVVQLISGDRDIGIFNLSKMSMIPKG